MRKNWLLIGVGLLIAVLAIGAIACGDDDGDGDNGDGDGNGDTGTVVGIRLLEFSVIPDPSSVAAGDVTFEATNEGAINHELAIVRTDLQPGDLPTLGDGSVDEAQVEVIGRIAELESAGTGSQTFTLEAGSYVLICNLVTTQEGADPDIHYTLGMRLAFDVTE
jgi:hypothetical protein